jgi:hypothetical protein
MLIDKVLPAIRAKWPCSWRGKSSNTILIEQDNAKPHSSGTEFELASALNQDGFDIRLASQPPNSPDMNVLDLGLFRAIQSLQHQLPQKGIDSLIAATEQAYWSMDPEKLNNIFLSWQQCMIEVMRNDGCNRYKLPHMGKSALQRKGQLPDRLQCPVDVIEHTKRIVSPPP